MFESISWQEFLSTIALTVGGYYAITTLLLYSNEIKSIFKQKERKQITSESTEDQNDSNESIDLMGKVKYDTEVNVPHEMLIAVEEIQVQSSNENEEAVEGSVSVKADVVIIGTIADLLQEVKALSAAVKDSGKEEAVSLFTTLLSRYRQLVGTRYQEAVSLFIYDACKDKCEFNIEPNEIKSWWSEAESLSSNTH